MKNLKIILKSWISQKLRIGINWFHLWETFMFKFNNKNKKIKKILYNLTKKVLKIGLKRELKKKNEIIFKLLMVYMQKKISKNNQSRLNNYYRKIDLQLLEI